MVYRAWDDFEILKESRHAYAVVDYAPGKCKMLWANTAMCAIWGRTHDEFLQFDMNNSSEAATAMHLHIYEVVQQDKQTYQTVKTVGNNITASFHLSPIDVLFPSSEEEQKRVLMELEPMVSNDESDEAKILKRSNEMLHHIAVATMSFDLKDGSEIFSNRAAQAMYHKSTEERNQSAERTKIQIDDVLASYMWSKVSRIGGC